MNDTKCPTCGRLYQGDRVVKIHVAVAFLCGLVLALVANVAKADDELEKFAASFPTISHELPLTVRERRAIDKQWPRRAEVSFAWEVGNVHRTGLALPLLRGFDSVDGITEPSRGHYRTLPATLPAVRSVLEDIRKGSSVRLTVELTRVMPGKRRPKTSTRAGYLNDLHCTSGRLAAGYLVRVVRIEPLVESPGK